jgi:hypothetical protein
MRHTYNRFVRWLARRQIAEMADEIHILRGQRDEWRRVATESQAKYHSLWITYMERK